MHKPECTPIVGTVPTVWLPQAKAVTTIEVDGQNQAIALRAERGNVICISAAVPMGGTFLGLGGVMVTFQTENGGIALAAGFGVTRYVVGDEVVTGLVIRGLAAEPVDTSAVSVWLEGDVAGGDPKR